ncbi:MAG: gph 1 [Candidatus Saccharibacteria bacterium]|nr:gph 1 [Candidatus Saccharibacteria bacterium]
MKTLLFDFDGTIADSFEFVFGFLVNAGNGRTYSLEERQAFRYMSMPSIAREVGVAAWRLPFLLYKGRRQMRKQLDSVRPFSDIPPLIRELNGQGYRMMILSSNIEPTIRSFLLKHDLEEYFEDIYGEVGLFGKGPALRKLIAKHHLNAEECVYIGDETRDVKASQSVNIDCIAVTWGFANPMRLRAAKPYAVVSTSRELRSEIAKTNAQP